MSSIHTIGGGITLVVILLSLVVITSFLKWYHPHVKLSKWLTFLTVLLTIMGLAFSQVLFSQAEEKGEDEAYVDLYQKAHLVYDQDAVTSKLHIKHKWEQDPTLENKYLYALALLKNNEIQKGKNLLLELKDQASLSEYVTEKRIETTLEKVHNRMNMGGEGTTPIELAAEEELTAWKQQLAEGKEVSLLALESLAKYDVDRLTVMHYSGNQQQLDDLKQNLYKMVENTDISKEKSSIVKKELAKSFYYIEDNRMAETLLIDVLKEEPGDQDSASLLSQLYLEGDYQPSERAEELPQYQRADLRSIRQRVEAYEQWHENNATDNQDSVSYEAIYDYGDQLANELAYTVLDTVQGGGEQDPYLFVRMSRYYFNKGDNETAQSEIRKMMDHQTELKPEEQYSINQLQTSQQKLDQSVGKVTFEDRRGVMEEQYEVKEELYDTLHAPKQSGPNQTTANKSYQHFLTESVQNPEPQELAITSVKGTPNGKVEMYVSAQNIDDLSPDTLSIQDNGEEIKDVKVEGADTFNHSSDAFRSIGMVIDASGSMSGNRINIAKQSSASFLRGIGEYEKAELVAFSNSQQLMQPLTSDRDKLANSAMNIEVGGGTNITEALLYEIDRLRSHSGHKVLFIFSDGEDERFLRPESRARIIQQANQSGVTIYSVGFGAGYETLSEVAKETGGTYLASPNEAAIMSGFSDISNRLGNVYKVSYTVSSPEKTDRVAKILYKDLHDKRAYTLGIQEEEGSNVEKIEEQFADEFYVQHAKPNTIKKTNGAEQEISLYGAKLNTVKQVQVGKETVEIVNKDDKKVDISLPKDLSYGEHLITVINEENNEESVSVYVGKAGPKDKIQFGWATLEADHCDAQEDENGKRTCMGKPSIDRFMYPSGVKMTLENDQKLTFHGVSFDVKGLDLNIFESIVNTNKPFVMEKQLHGEEFKITYGGGYSLGEAGMDLGLTSLKYTAKHEGEKDIQGGTFEGKAEFKGMSSITKLMGMPSLDLLTTTFNNAKASVEAKIAPASANFKGQVDLTDFDDLFLFDVGLPYGAVEADLVKRRVQLDMKFDTIKVFNKYEAHLNSAGISATELTLGYDPGGIRTGMTVEGNFKLGTTMLALTKAGLIMDHTTRNETVLKAGLGTAADGAVRTLTETLNDIEIAGYGIFDVKPAGLANLDLEGKIKAPGRANWEVSSKVDMKVIGYSIAKAEGKVNRDLIHSKYKMGEMNGSMTVMYSDPAYRDDLTLYTLNEFKPIKFVSGKAEVTLIPARFTDSEFTISGKAGWVDFHKTQDDLTLFN